MPAPPAGPNSPRSSSPLRGLVQAESMVQIALAVPAGCFVGLLFGAWLDRQFHTHWIVVAGMFLGAAGGFVQIFKVALKPQPPDSPDQSDSSGEGPAS